MKVAESLKWRVRIFFFFFLFHATFISRPRLPSVTKTETFCATDLRSRLIFFLFFPPFKKEKGLGGDLKADKTHTLRGTCVYNSGAVPVFPLPPASQNTLHPKWSRNATEATGRRGDNAAVNYPPFLLFKKKINKKNWIFKVLRKTKQQKKNQKKHKAPPAPSQNPYIIQRTPWCLCSEPSLSTTAFTIHAEGLKTVSFQREEIIIARIRASFIRVTSF